MTRLHARDLPWAVDPAEYDAAFPVVPYTDEELDAMAAAADEAAAEACRGPDDAGRVEGEAGGDGEFPW